MKKYLLIPSLIIVILILIIFNCIVYKNSVYNSNKTELISQNNMNIIWCGSLELAWNELINILNIEKIEFEDNSNEEVLNLLNKRKFTKSMISSEDYRILVENNSEIFKEKIKDYKIADEQIKMFDNKNSDGFAIYSYISKEFEFLEKFDILTNNRSFNKDITGVTYFGINDDSDDILDNNIEVLYYDYFGKYAVKLKTKGNDEVILYTLEENAYNSSFEELYNEILELESSYEESKKFEKVDIFQMPNIKIDTLINYNSLCGKEIKNSSGAYLNLVTQYIFLDMNNSGVKFESNAVIFSDRLGGTPTTTRKFLFNVPFVFFLKEAGKDEPYFAVKIIDSTFLDIKK